MKSPNVEDLKIVILVGDKPIEASVTTIDYRDAALFYGEQISDDAATERLLCGLGNSTRRSEASAVNGNRASKASYAGIAIVKAEKVVEISSLIKDGFDACVRYKAADIVVCDILLKCQPLIVVGTDIVCHVENILWDGRPPFGRDEAARVRGASLVSAAGLSNG